jgi:hypothetical protein
MQTGAPLSRWRSVASSADGSDLVAVADSGPIYSSTDSGATWVSNNASSRVWLSVASSSDGSKRFAAAYGGGIYTLEPALTLRITISGTNAVLSWPSSSSASGFVLQHSNTLSPANWTDVATIPTVTKGENQVTVSVSSGTTFFRLKQRT